MLLKLNLTLPTMALEDAPVWACMPSGGRISETTRMSAWARERAAVPTKERV